MGFLSKVTGFVKDSFKNNFRGGSLWKIVDKNIHTPATNKLQDMLGIGALKDMAAGQEEAMRLQGEKAKLDTMNEVDNIVKVDDSTTGEFTGGGSRRKKRQGGANSNAIGLQF